MARLRSVLVPGIGAWLLLALAVMLVALSVDHIDTTFTPWPTKAVFDWLNTIPAIYRYVVAGLLGAVGVALAVVTVRRYRALE